jgi:hypothetical protein
LVLSVDQPILSYPNGAAKLIALPDLDIITFLFKEISQQNPVPTSVDVKISLSYGSGPDYLKNVKTPGRG